MLCLHYVQKDTLIALKLSFIIVMNENRTKVNRLHFNINTLPHKYPPTIARLPILSVDTPSNTNSLHHNT